jgi:hypothetical protein
MFSGLVGITLDAAWSEPADGTLESREAAERGMQFQVSSSVSH